MINELIELQRCKHPEAITEYTEILDKADITYRLSSTASNFDLSSIGSGQDEEVIITVHKNQYKDARTALENEFIKVDLPDDHYLHNSTDQELIEIVGQFNEWSPFDVAHAHRMINERGIDLNKVEQEHVAYIGKLKSGRPASSLLILAGWVLTIVGAIGGIGISWSLRTMKDKTPYGEFYTYDKESRETGLYMQICSTFMAVFLIVTYFLPE